MNKAIKLNDKELDKLIKLIGAREVIYKHIYLEIELTSKQLDYVIQKERESMKVEQ